MIPIVYYAHNLSIYDTEQEQKELALIEQYFPTYLVYNPNRPDVQNALDPMKKCFEIVHDESVTDIVFSMLSGGVIGSGVYGEIRAAQKQWKPVFVIQYDIVLPFTGSVELIRSKKPVQYKVL